MNLANYSNAGFDRGASCLKEALWLLIRQVLFLGCPFGCYRLKRTVLRWFGARIGQGVIIKPGVKITFPWKLTIGDHVWLGEECWLLNLDRIEIGAHVCIAQRAMLCTGNHNYKSPTFDLIVQPVKVEQGAWIATGAWVGPGVHVGAHAVLAAGSVTSHDLEPSGIYRGNPAIKEKERKYNLNPET